MRCVSEPVLLLRVYVYEVMQVEDRELRVRREHATQSNGAGPAEALASSE